MFSPSSPPLIDLSVLQIKLCLQLDTTEKIKQRKTSPTESSTGG